MALAFAGELLRRIFALFNPLIEQLRAPADPLICPALASSALCKIGTKACNEEE